MKQYHPSQQSTPKRSRAKKRRVKFAPRREETPFSKPQNRGIRFLDAVYLVVTVMVGSALIGLCFNSFSTYSRTREQFNRHTAQLKQLQTREKSLDQRLARLKSPDGRDQLLRERGFIKGNERILLFADDVKPANSDEKSTQPQPAVSPSTDAGNANPSFWGGVAQAIDRAADRPVVH